MQQRPQRPRSGWTPLRGLLSPALALWGSATACAPPAVEPPAAPQAAAHPPAPADAPASAAKAAPPSDPAGGPPRISVDQVKGGSIEYARAIVAPTARIMNECRAGGPTAIRVRITSTDGEAELHVEPGSALDGSIRRCVLEALSTIELPDTTPRGNGALPSSFSSLVTIEW